MILAVPFQVILNAFPLPLSIYYGYYIISLLLVIVFFLIGYIFGSRVKPPYLLSSKKQKKLAERILRQENKKKNSNTCFHTSQNTNATIISVDKEIRNNPKENLGNQAYGRSYYNQYNPYGKYNSTGPGYHNRPW